MLNPRYALLLIACAALLGPARAQGSFDGTYTGERVLSQGNPGACVAKEPVSATIHGDELTFTNSQAKDHTIAFYLRPDGSFVQLSADIGGHVVDIRGHVSAGVVDADVSSAGCTHHWHLEKQH